MHALSIQTSSKPSQSKQTIETTIQNYITQDAVVLFMKGTPDAPMCGFSSVVAQVLKSMNVPFQSYNVLEDDALRQGIKTFSNWPTIPQLYIRGEFVGGCDIVKEMYQSGELETVLL
ncbi:MAG: Grx4 family monothiol glutaredoxin [Candidatus Comchoanobacterales bacterium]